MQNSDHLTQNAHVVSAVLLGLCDDCRQRVGKVLEQGVLLVDLHAQNTVQELPDVVVVCCRNKALDLCEHFHKTVRTFNSRHVAPFNNLNVITFVQ